MVALDSTVAEYVYDGTGRRVQKTVGADKTRYVYDGSDVICEYNANDALVARYIIGRSIDEPMRMERLIDENWHTYYYHTNALGTIAALTEWDAGESKEKIVERYTYDAYGRLLVHTPGADGIFGTSDDDYSATSSVGNPYGFTARRLDAETGLMYYRARYYSTALGRFIQRDMAVQSLAPTPDIRAILAHYVYCLSGPMLRVDPLGRNDILGGIVHVAGEVVHIPVATGVGAVDVLGGGLTGQSIRIYKHQCVCITPSGEVVVKREVTIVEGGLANTLMGSGMGGMTIGQTIFISSAPSGGTGLNYWQDLLRHECGHTEQARMLGPFYLPIVGGTTWLGRKSSWERQASAIGGSVHF